MNGIALLGATVVVGAGLGAGITALATRSSEDGEKSAFGAAKGLGITAGVAGGLGIAGIAYATKNGGGLLDSFLSALFIGVPSAGLALTGVAVGGAAVGATLVGVARD
jgi:hypothetical protein